MLELAGSTGFEPATSGLTEHDSPIRDALSKWRKIVGVGADAFERSMPIGDRIHLTASVTPYRTNNQITEKRIVVNHEDSRSPKTSPVNISVRAAVAWFAIGKGLAADWTGVNHQPI